MTLEDARSWTLLSPMGLRGEGPSPDPPGGLVGRADVLGCLSTRRPNAAALQRLLAERVRESLPELEVRFYEKANSSLGAGEELLNVLAADCGLVINGTGD